MKFIPHPTFRLWTLRLTKIALVALLLILALQALLLPLIVRRVVASLLRQLDYAQATFDVRATSFWRTDLADIRLDQQHRIDAITIDYTPWSLLSGRVRTIHINGAQLDLTLPDQPTQTTAETTPQAPFPQVDLPFDHLQIRSSAIQLLWNNRQLWLPIEGALVNTGPNRGQLNLLARLQGVPVHLAGQFDTASQQLNLTANATALDAPSLLAMLPEKLTRAWPTLSAGQLSFQAAHTRQGSTAQTRATINLQQVKLLAALGADHLWAEGVGGTLTAELDAQYDLTTLNGRISANQIHVARQTIRNLDLTARRDADRLLIHATAHGRDWRVNKLAATVGGVFGPDAHKTYLAQVSLNAQALPAQLARVLSLPNLDLATLGNLSAEGDLTLRLTPPTQSGQRLAWQASTDNLVLNLAPGRWVANNTELIGLAANLTLRGVADPTRATLRITPGSSLWIDQLDQGDQRLLLDKLDDAAPLAALAIQDQPAELTLNLADSQNPWHLMVPAAQLKLAPVDLTAGLDQPTQIDRLHGALRVQVNAQPRRTDVSALPQSAVAFESLQVVTGGEPLLRVGAWNLNLAPQPNQPLLRLLSIDKGFASRLTFRADASTPLILQTRQADVTLPQFSASGTANLRSGSKPSFLGQVTLQDASALLKPDQFQVAKASATIPIAWNAQPGPRGPFTIQSLQVGDATYPPLSGTLGIAGRRADFDLLWPILEKAASLTATGFVDLSGPEPLGRIDASVPPFTVTDPTTLSTLIRNKELEGLDITGTFAANAQVQFRGSDIKPRVTLTLKDANVATAEEKSAEGITGTVVIDSFAPFTSPGGQRLTVKKATVGQLQLAEGVLVFRIEAADRFLVEETDWAWAGGRLYSSSFRLDLRRPRVDLAITADRLSLAQTLDVFLEEDVSGEGTLYGRLPVAVIWPQVLEEGEVIIAWSQPLVEFGQGFIYATPGGGRLRIAKPEEYFGEALNRQDPHVKAAIVSALKDLNYSVLKMDFLKEQDDSLAKVFIAGKARTGRDPAEIGGLTLNIRGYDKYLRAYLRLPSFSFGQ